MTPARSPTAVGRDLGIDEVFAEVLPEDKDQAVSRAAASAVASVAMVGDGVNDAPALARADVGLAIGAGTDVAIESAGVVLASSDPRGVAGVIRLSRASYRKMIQNLAWAAGYNVVAIPLAAGVLAWAGITLSPAVGAVLMSLSTIVVALNAQLLRRVRLTPTGDGTRVTPIPPSGILQWCSHARLARRPASSARSASSWPRARRWGARRGGHRPRPGRRRRALHDGGHADPATQDRGCDPGGLAVSRDGYTLDLRTPVVEPRCRPNWSSSSRVRTARRSPLRDRTRQGTAPRGRRP